MGLGIVVSGFGFRLVCMHTPYAHTPTHTHMHMHMHIYTCT